MKYLTLEIGEIDPVAVGQPECTDTGSGKVIGCRRPQSAKTDYQYPAFQQPLLAFLPNFLEEDVALVALSLLLDERDHERPLYRAPRISDSRTSCQISLAQVGM